MDWFKFQVNDLASNALSAADDAAVGVWFRMLAACYRLENGGCFKHCAKYSDRQWISIAAVDRAAIEVAESAGLVSWGGDCLMVLGYDVAQETRATQLKSKGRDMAAARWGKPRSDASPDAASIASGDAAEKVSNAKREERRGEEKEEEKGGEEESAEAAGPPSPPTPSEPPVLVFPCRGKVDSWPLVQSQVDAWVKLYPGLDVLGEMRKALAWCYANPTKQSTDRGIVARLVNWLNRAADGSGRVRLFGVNGQQMPLAPARPAAPAKTRAQFEAEKRAAEEAAERKAREFREAAEKENPKAASAVAGLVAGIAQAKGV